MEIIVARKALVVPQIGHLQRIVLTVVERGGKHVLHILKGDDASLSVIIARRVFRI